MSPYRTCPCIYCESRRFIDNVKLSAFRTLLEYL